jgi:hypothetical protein
VTAIPTLHHLEIVALRANLAASLHDLRLRGQALRVPELPRLDAARLEALAALIETNAVLRSGARSLRAGRAWLIGVLLSLLVALQEDEKPRTERGSGSHEERGADRATPTSCAETMDSRVANRALRFNKSCVLWARYLS